MLLLMKPATTMMEEEEEGEIMRIKSAQILGPKIARCLGRVQQDESTRDALKKTRLLNSDVAFPFLRFYCLISRRSLDFNQVSK